MTNGHKRRRVMRRIVLRGWMMAGLLLALVACGGGGDEGGSNGDTTDGGPTATPSPAESLITTDLSEGDTGISGEDRVLAWIGAAPAPGQQSASAPGQIVWINGNGRTETLFDLPTGTSRVNACGEQATSPDGRYFAFFAGGDSGSLYLVDGTRDPREVRTMSALGCNSVGSFQYTPDGERFAVIDFEPDAASSDFARGFLYVYATADAEQITRLENVSAFDMSDSGLALVGFFTDSEDRATEAAVSIWQDGEPDEIATLFAGNGCQFSSGQVVFTGPDSLAVVVGQTCSGSGTGWAFYTVDISTGTANRALEGTTAGSFFSYARTNGLYTQPGGGIVYYTLPDGLTANTVSVRAALLDDLADGDDLIRSGVMPRFSNRPYDPARSAPPVVSPDGRWAAIASSDANGNAAVSVLDLSDSSLRPFSIRAGSAGDTVSSMAFTADSAQLLFVAGGNNGGDNSLFALDLASGVESRVTRGHFVEVVPAPDHSAVGVSAWAFPDDPNQPMYMTLDIIALPGGETDTLATGATITEDGRVQDRHFVYPLSWRG